MINKKRKFPIPELPTHTIFDILTRLPIKNLLDCQLICKDWLSLISDPHFAKTHLSNSPISLLIKPIYHHHQQIRLIGVSLQTLPNSDPANAQMIFKPKMHNKLSKKKIVNSCNGLICSKDDSFYITNPILGEYNISISLASHVGKYDRTSSAIGYSPLTNKYKVIQFFLKQVSYDTVTMLRTDQAEADIYTLGEGPWRSLGRVPYHLPYYLPKYPFNSFVNGALHWLNFTPDSLDFIHRFDFGSEEFWVDLEPCEFGLEKKALLNRMSVGVLKDSLAMCDCSSPHHVEIWIMKHYNIQESWCKEFVIEKSATVKGQHFTVKYCEPIMILKSGDIFMLVNKNAPLQYDSKFGSFKNLNICKIKSAFCVVGHIPSFASPADVVKGERCTVYYKRKCTEILDRMWEHMMGQSSGCAAHKQLHVHRNPNDPSGEECLLELKMLPGITEGDPLYMFGAMLLVKCDTRKESMGLASDEIRLAWLKEKMR